MLKADKTTRYSVRHKKCIGHAFLKQRNPVTNVFVSSVVLALYYFYAQAHDKFGSPRIAPSMQGNTYIATAAMGAIFLKTTEQHSKTTYAQHCVFIPSYTYLLWLKNMKLAVFCVYKLH